MGRERDSEALMDKDVILHIIDGPGATWGWIVFSIVAGFVIVFLVRTYNSYEVGFREGKAAERRAGLDQIRAQMAKLSFDQQQMMNRIPERSDAGTGSVES
jgi:hypothetical protein